MSKRILGILAILSVLFLWSCSEEGETVILERATEDGVIFSPSAVFFELSFKQDFTPTEVNVVRLDYDLSPLDTIPTSFDKGKIYGRTDTVEFICPYVKFLVKISGVNKLNEMTLEYYFNIAEHKDSLMSSTYGDKFFMNLPRALAAGRIHRLVTEKEMPLTEAILSSYNQIDTAFSECWNSFSMEMFRSDSFDSVFIQNFQDLKDLFVEHDFLPDSLKVLIADYVLESSAPKEFVHNGVLSGYVFPVEPPQRFMEKILGLDSCSGKNLLILDTVKNETSKFAGEPLACGVPIKMAGIVYSDSWRFLTDVEKELGLCTSDEKKYGVSGEKLYFCGNGSSSWVISTDTSNYFAIRDNLAVQTKYGVCNKDAQVKALRYFEDTLYVCSNRGGEAVWTRSESAIKYYHSDSLRSAGAYEDASVALNHGNCNDTRVDEAIQDSGKFYLCRDWLWMEVDEIEFQLGRCDMAKEGEMGLVQRDSLDTLFLVCRKNYWKDTTAWGYYDDVCDSTVDLTVFQHEGASYWCIDDTFKKLSEENLVPPTFDKQACAAWRYDKMNTILKYDTSYYTCTSSGWRLSKEEELLPPVLQGDFCIRDARGVIVAAGQGYYKCDNYNRWEETTERAYLQYTFVDEHQKDCKDGIVGTTLQWSDAHNALAGCRKYYQGDSAAFGTYSVTYGGSPKIFAGGEFINDTLYRVKVGKLTYEFRTEQNWDWFAVLFPQKAYEGEVADANYKYDPYTESDAIFLHAVRGDDEVEIDDIPNKSASFDEFYAKWLERVPQDHVSNGRLMTEAITDRVTARWMNENSYMDYATAKVFCPEGYHIPDTTEWTFTAKLSLQTRLKNYRNDSPIVERSTMQKPVVNYSTNYEHFYDIFWSSTEKDGDTQYCLEYVWDYFEHEIARRFVECSKDLYPMVQAECVKD